MFIVKNAYISTSKLFDEKNSNYKRLCLGLTNDNDAEQIINLFPPGQLFDTVYIEGNWRELHDVVECSEDKSSRRIVKISELDLEYDIYVSKVSRSKEICVSICFHSASTSIVFPKILNMLEIAEVFIAPETICELRENLGLLSTKTILNEVVVLLKDMQDDDEFCEQFAQINAPYFHSPQAIKNISFIIELRTAIASLLYKRNFVKCATLMLQPIRHCVEAKKLSEDYNLQRASEFLYRGSEETLSKAERLLNLQNKLPALLSNYGKDGLSLSKLLLPELAGCGYGDALCDNKGAINLETYATDPNVIVRLLALLRKSNEKTATTVTTTTPGMLLTFNSRVTNKVTFNSEPSDNKFNNSLDTESRACEWRM